MTLVDTNVLLDLVTDDPRWVAWSIAQLEAAALRGPLRVNALKWLRSPPLLHRRL